MTIFRKLQLGLVLLLSAAGLSTPALALGPLITATELQQALNAEAPLIIDIRTASADPAKPSAFEQGHIATSVNAPYNLFRGPKENPGELISEAKLTELLRSLGVTEGRPLVVAYQGKDATDFGAAARVYWTLKSSGFTDLAILNGGINAWSKQGLPLEKGAGITPERSAIEVKFSTEWLATRSDVQGYIESESQTRLLDARPEAFWAGNAKHKAAAQPGTLPHSSYFDQARWFNAEQPTLLDASLVPVLTQQNGFNPDDSIVSFCNTGHWAATNWFVLSELAQVEDVKLYPESLVGWSNAGGQMENVPGLFRNLMNKVAGKY